MEKTKVYSFTHFDPETIASAHELCSTLSKQLKALRLQVQSDLVTTWEHESLAEFLADYRDSRGSSVALFNCHTAKVGFQVSTSAGYGRTPNGHDAWGWETTVSVNAPSRELIERVFSIFEANHDSARMVPEPRPAPKKEPPTVFIGHGRSPLWRDLKDHLAEHHGYGVKAFESGARAGHVARDVLEELLAESSFALLVLTAEDEQADGGRRARQNVVHEAGLFQGKLGFRRAILLLEDGCEGFSNVAGLQHIPFSRGNIREVFGDVLATLRREFGED